MGLILAFIAQLQMKDSWRISLDQENNFDLVDTGLFSYSRNPIYIALIVAYVGLFLIVPSIFSLAFVMVMWVAIILKVGDEERFLERKLGSKYSKYKERVRRWI